jgi:hypothetical protein
MTSVDRIQGLSGSLAVKAPCRLATTANITLYGLQSIDGVTTALGDRVLVKDQTTTSENGIYDADDGTWTRSRDADGSNDAVTGTMIVVTAGGAHADSVWRVTTAGTVVFGSSNITFAAALTGATGPEGPTGPAGADGELAAADIGVTIQGYDADIPTVAASQVEMEAGTEAALRSMSPLRVAQAIDALATTTQIQSISASVAANALTISASALTLDFRSATLTSGAITTVTDTPTDLVVSSTSTLGTVSGQQSRLAVLALNNAGTIELAVVNMSGGVLLTETGVISATAEGGVGGADSAATVYANASHSNLAYRVIGYVESTQATAGTWATAPSTIQGAGGNALTAMSSLGYGQTWQNVTGSRALTTTYYNTTGRPILVSISTAANLGVSSALTVNTLTISTQFAAATTTHTSVSIIPPGGSYSITATTLSNWFELR